MRPPRRLRHLATLAGIRLPRMNLHMLRHTFVTTVLYAGVERSGDAHRANAAAETSAGLATDVAPAMSQSLGLLFGLRVRLERAGAGMPRGQDAGSSAGQVHESAEPRLGDVFVDGDVMDVGTVNGGSLVSLHVISKRTRAVVLRECAAGDCEADEVSWPRPAVAVGGADRTDTCPGHTPWPTPTLAGPHAENVGDFPVSTEGGARSMHSGVGRACSRRRLPGRTVPQLALCERQVGQSSRLAQESPWTALVHSLWR
jgi:hypothetical protein